MNSVKVKQTVAAIWLALTLIFGGGLLNTHINGDSTPSVYACGLGDGGGGGCQTSNSS